MMIKKQRTGLTATVTHPMASSSMASHDGLSSPMSSMTLSRADKTEPKDCRLPLKGEIKIIEARLLLSSQLSSRLSPGENSTVTVVHIHSPS